MKKIKFHRVSELDLPRSPFSYLILLRIVSVEHLHDFKHWGLDLFQKKGIKCANPNCKREGYYITLSVTSAGTLVYHLLSKDLVLMTKDHIIPKSKGGIECITNYQPMCLKCNQEKGDIHTPVRTKQVDSFEKRIEEFKRKTTERLNKIKS